MFFFAKYASGSLKVSCRLDMSHRSRRRAVVGGGVVDVCDRSGVSTPVFLDEHLLSQHLTSLSQHLPPNASECTNVKPRTVETRRVRRRIECDVVSCLLCVWSHLTVLTPPGAGVNTLY